MHQNTHNEHIWYEVFHLHNILTPMAPKMDVMGPELDRWCYIHTVKGNHIEDCYQLKNEIERLI